MSTKVYNKLGYDAAIVAATMIVNAAIKEIAYFNGDDKERYDAKRIAIRSMALTAIDELFENGVTEAAQRRLIANNTGPLMNAEGLRNLAGWSRLNTKKGS